MAKMDPVPKHSSIRPRVPSDRAWRAFTDGISGAQAAMPKPAMKKTIRVNVRAGRPTLPEAETLGGRPFCDAITAAVPNYLYRPLTTRGNSHP